MPLPLTISCLSKIQTGFTLGGPGKRAVKRVCVCVCVCVPSSQPSWRYVAAEGQSSVTTHVIFPWTTSTSASKDASSLTTRPPRISSCWSRPAPAPAPAYTDTNTLRSRVLFQPESYGRVARFPPTKYGRCLSISSSMLTRQGPPTPTV